MQKSFNTLGAMCSQPLRQCCRPMVQLCRPGMPPSLPACKSGGYQKERSSPCSWERALQLSTFFSSACPGQTPSARFHHPHSSMESQHAGLTEEQQPCHNGGDAARHTWLRLPNCLDMQCHQWQPSCIPVLTHAACCAVSPAAPVSSCPRAFSGTPAASTACRQGGTL